MTITRLLLLLFMSTATAVVSPPRDEPKYSSSERALIEFAESVQTADYRGDRARLAELIAVKPKNDAAPLATYWDYWRGFALWRRSVNAFSETPMPADVKGDLDRAAAIFRSILTRDPNMIDAQVGLTGCLGSLAFVAHGEETALAALLKEITPVLRTLQESTAPNPRRSWMLGGLMMATPPPRGGDVAKATALFLDGLAAVREEASRSSSRPPWEPAWGGPELLMSLAYLHANSPAPNKELARAYLAGALVARPDWRYARDVLRPQIEALP